jgi:hypothetical protein
MCNLNLEGSRFTSAIHSLIHLNGGKLFSYPQSVAKNNKIDFLEKDGRNFCAAHEF